MWEGIGSRLGAGPANVAAMSRPIITPALVTSAVLALTVASAGCGTEPEATARPVPAPPAPTIAARLDGLYTAAITSQQLRTALPNLPVRGGTWALRIDVAARRLQLIPPAGGDITLRLTGIGASRLRLAPDTACESRSGRSAASHFTWAKTDSLLQLQSVRAPCRSDAAVLTLMPWRAVWPATPLSISGLPSST